MAGAPRLLLPRAQRPLLRHRAHRARGARHGRDDEALFPLRVCRGLPQGQRSRSQEPGRSRLEETPDRGQPAELGRREHSSGDGAQPPRGRRQPGRVHHVLQ